MNENKEGPRPFAAKQTTTTASSGSGTDDKLSGHADRLHEHACTLISQGDFTRAETVLQQASSLDPNNASIQKTLNYLQMAAHQYNFSAGSTPPEPSHNVPEDFDFTSFLLQSQIPDATADGHVPDGSWPQRVQDIKRAGNPMSGYGMSENYTRTGWSPIGAERADLGMGESGTSIYNSSCWAPGGSTVGNSVYHGANPSYDTGTLGYAGSNPGYDSNLSRIWSSDGALYGQKGSDDSGAGVDFGTTATEGRDMYGYAWNEWERPPADRSRSNTASPVANPKNKNTSAGASAKGIRNCGGRDLEELRAAFFSGNRKERGESSVSAQSSTSWQSKGNTSAKDGCSNSSKTYSDITKEAKHSGKTHETPKVHHSSNAKKHRVNSGNREFQTTSKLASHYHSVTPPPGFESSTLHMPEGPDSQYGLDDFMGTSAKVQQWLQQSQSQGVEEEPINVTRRKRSKKKKKSKKPDPLAGSVASFIRDWNSGTSESTDPSSLDEINKTCASSGTVNPTKVEDGNPSKSTDNSSHFCKPQENLHNAPVKKEDKAFFDPRRIFQETAKKPEEKKNPCKVNTDTSQNFFDPKRIFQTGTTERKVHAKPRKEKDSWSEVNSKKTVKPNSCDQSNFASQRTHNSNTSTGSPHKYPGGRSAPVNPEQSDPQINHIKTGKANPPVEEIGVGTYKAHQFPPQHFSPSSGLSRQHSNGSGDNSPIKNKGSAYTKSGAHSGVGSVEHGKARIEAGQFPERKGSGARPDSCASQGQDSKANLSANYSHKDFSPPKGKKEEKDMRTRSQSRREAEQAFKHSNHAPGGDDDGIHASKWTFSHHQDFTPATDHKSSRHHKAFNHADDNYDTTFTKDNSSASYHSIPSAEKSKTSPNPPSSTSSSKHPGKSQQHESQPGWKRNKTSKNARSEARTNRHGREKKDLPRHHSYRSDSPGNMDHNGTAKVGRHKETGEKSGRNRQDSDGTRSDTAAHYYDADQFYQWMKAIVRFAIWIAGFIVFLFLVLTAYLFSTCKVWIEYIIHIARELWKSIAETLGSNNPDASPRWWSSWTKWFHRGGEDSGRDRHNSGNGCGCKQRHGKQTEFVELPTSSSEAIKRIMACDPEDAYAVLGVGDKASDEEIKKYYRKQCVMVHPDKCNLQHANDAFQMLQKGYETLSDPMKRYDLDRQRSSAWEAEDMLNDIYEKMKEAMNTLNCNMCENKHKRYPMERPCYAARYCSRHDTYHGATEGDMWAETTHLGFKWHYYACMDDAVFDITEWAKCQNLRHMEANACDVRYRIGSNRRRHHGPFVPRDSEPPPWQQPPWQQHHGFEDFGNPEEELDDLLRNIFGDRASRTANDPRSSGHNSGRSSNRKRRHRKKKY